MLQMLLLLSNNFLLRKQNSPPGDSPMGRTYCRLNAEDTLQTSGMSSCSAPMSIIFLGM
jgi:hypothetical protein